MCFEVALEGVEILKWHFAKFKVLRWHETNFPFLKLVIFGSCALVLPMIW
jgi:hypothetical protein